jgi:hypothetical protein
VSDKISIKKKSLLLRIAAVLAILGMAGYFLIPPYLNKQHARSTVLPAIQKIADDNLYVPTDGCDMALEAEKYIAEDSVLIKLCISELLESYSFFFTLTITNFIRDHVRCFRGPIRGFLPLYGICIVEPIYFYTDGENIAFKDHLRPLFKPFHYKWG